MPLPKRYDPGESEPRLINRWINSGIYHFSREAGGPIYAIDTPPATVSGNLHLGHVFSYSHADFIARFQRMNGQNVFYPIGYDDNGLPTERLVEKRMGVTATQVGRTAFIEKCLQMSEEAEKDYQALWQRLGLSIDWRYTYRTIDARSRCISQYSFIDLYRKGRVYRQEAPTIWCPECQTAIAQAELNDLERQSEFVTLAFRLPNGDILPVATTRPEMLRACVAVFVHPDDKRYQQLVGQMASVPLYNHLVPILQDPNADPEKGTGAVMCCTFGDATDVAWWYTYKLPLVQILERDGKMTQTAGNFAGRSVLEARREITRALDENNLILDRQPVTQSVRVHERCDTPVEYIVTRQWFVRLLDAKETFLEAGDQVSWHPQHMQARYRAWVENLNWDWCISRQRYFGVPFPVWYCEECGEVVLANENQLPVDPADQSPIEPCKCGSTSFIPEEDVMDTWATSSLSPQIAGQWEAGKAATSAEYTPGAHLFPQVFPFSLRPQAHEIIRTWAFYTIVKSHYHFGELPWKDVLISGWGLAGEGMGKISKSRGGGPLPPSEMIQRYSADAVRYWAASTGPGKDALISEEKIQMGAKLATKLWNVARFSEPFISDYTPPADAGLNPVLSPADRWILSRLQRLVGRVTGLYENYDYASAKSETEAFFWTELADNYLEMCKQRLYDRTNPLREGARFALYHLLRAILKLLAPILPFVTEEIYQELFAAGQESISIHRSSWPIPEPALVDDQAERVGEVLVEIATAIRRYKSEHNLPLGTDIERLELISGDSSLAKPLGEATADLASITRAREVSLVKELDATVESVLNGQVVAAISPIEEAL